MLAATLLALIKSGHSKIKSATIFSGAGFIFGPNKARNSPKLRLFEMGRLTRGRPFSEKQTSPLIARITLIYTDSKARPVDRWNEKGARVATAPSQNRARRGPRGALNVSGEGF